MSNRPRWHAGGFGEDRHFYKYTPPRPLEEIDADLKKAEEDIMQMLREVTE